MHTKVVQLKVAHIWQNLTVFQWQWYHRHIEVTENRWQSWSELVIIYLSKVFFFWNSLIWCLFQTLKLGSTETGEVRTAEVFVMLIFVTLLSIWIAVEGITLKHFKIIFQHSDLSESFVSVGRCKSSGLVNISPSVPVTPFSIQGNSVGSTTAITYSSFPTATSLCEIPMFG